MRSGQTYFTANQAATVENGLGIGGQLSAALGINNPKSSMVWHLGVQQKLATYSQTDSGAAYTATYGLIRAEMIGVYINIGFAPVVWRQAGGSGFEGLQRVTGGYGFLAEVGYSWVITPEIAFITSGTLSMLTAGAAGPIMVDGLAGFRLFYGEYKADTSRAKWEGYRYPYGVEKPR